MSNSIYISRKQNNAFKLIKSYYSLVAFFYMGLHKIDLTKVKKIKMSASDYISFETIIIELKLEIIIQIDNDRDITYTSSFSKDKKIFKIREEFTSGSTQDYIHLYNQDQNLIEVKRVTNTKNEKERIAITTYEYNKDKELISEDGWLGKFQYTKDKKIEKKNQKFDENGNITQNINIFKHKENYHYNKDNYLVRVNEPSQFQSINYEITMKE